MSSSSSSSGGIGFAGVLTVAFIVLKLCGVIAWSWWWVLSPIWIVLALVVVVVMVALAVIIPKHVSETRACNRARGRHR